MGLKSRPGRYDCDHFSAHDIANRMAAGSDIAHQRETANASARISAHLNDEPICVLKTTGKDRIEFMCEVDPDCSWEGDNSPGGDI